MLLHSGQPSSTIKLQLWRSTERGMIDTIYFLWNTSVSHCKALWDLWQCATGLQSDQMGGFKKLTILNLHKWGLNLPAVICWKTDKKQCSAGPLSLEFTCCVPAFQVPILQDSTVSHRILEKACVGSKQEEAEVMLHNLPASSGSTIKTQCTLLYLLSS